MIYGKIPSNHSSIINPNPSFTMETRDLNEVIIICNELIISLMCLFIHSNTLRLSRDASDYSFLSMATDYHHSRNAKQTSVYLDK